MASKNKIRIFAILMVLVLMTASLPNLTPALLADTATDTENAANAAGTTDEAASGEEEEEAQKVDENGLVIQDGAQKKKKKSEWITIKDYEKVAESDTYELYLYEKTLSIMLKNKKTGKYIESTLSDENDDGTSNAAWNGYMKSGVVVSAIMGVQNTYQADFLNNENTKKITKTDDGFSAEIYFGGQYNFGFTLNVKLDGSDLIVTIPDDSIKEDKEGTYISTISIFPFMGYSHLDAHTGYMFVPDGNGALINLDNKEGRYSTGFSQMIYGDDVGLAESDKKKYLWDELDMLEKTNKVLAPIFGMVHTDEQTGYLGIVENGDKRASIEVQPNGATVNYNRCFAKFLLRDIYVQPLNNSNSGTVTQAETDRTHSDLQVRYKFLSGDEANYAKMAEKYRDYLLQNNKIAKKNVAYNTRVDFLGTDREQFLLGTTAVTMTKASDIKGIFSELQSKGVSSLLSVYRGWQDGGLYNVPIRNYSADGNIGGNGELSSLIKESAAKNYNVYLYNDALRLNPETNRFNFNTIKKVNKRQFEEEVWAEVYKKFNYLSPDTASDYLNGYVDSCVGAGSNKLAIGGISNNVFSYSQRSEYFYRPNTTEIFSKALANAASKADVILEEPCEYAWNSTNAFLNMPLGSSDYMYVDEEIPFLSMVLKGIVPMYSDYVNFEANKNEFKLQMIEAGVYPSFYLTKQNSSALIYTNSANLYSTEYSTYANTVVEFDKEFREIDKAVGDATITNHKIVADGVVVVEYSNGTKIYINYNNNDRSVETEKVPAMSYVCKAGDK